MVPPERLLAFVPVVLLLVLVPGPSVLFVVGRSLSLGRRGGLLSVLGNALGNLPLIVAVACGVGAVVAASATAFTALKLAGAAYLVWLGVSAIRHRHRAALPEPVDGTATRLLVQGFVVGATNPKTLVFFAAVLPQFTDPAAGSVPAQILLLGAVFVAVALVCDALWALGAGRARHWFARSPRRLADLSAGGGVAMIGLGGVVALSGRHA
ncbi:LysE family translocator [Nocardiopsis sp. CC223A]|uniref:LysE family translocator n=1 Tax=Nocardiopsis sp. CC223A TaxID=3044051 RepID=UPI00278C4229|nr:LysE family translocator [Nocardiopsis sp. CC223A]